MLQLHIDKQAAEALVAGEDVKEAKKQEPKPKGSPKRSQLPEIIAWGSKIRLEE